MRISALPLVVICLTVGSGGVAVSQQVNGNQNGAPVRAAEPTLPYKLVEWPTPATSAAGFPAAWNLIQASSVAVTSRGTILVLHRGAHPILEFESSGIHMRSWSDGMFS